jgi:hypothetical protein
MLYKNNYIHHLLTAIFLFASVHAANSAVRISEICAESSDRLIRWSDDNSARLGSGISWYETDFDSKYWKTGIGSMGEGTSDITTDLSNEMGTIPSLYIRKTFTVSESNAASSQDLQLWIDYNDGFVAYLNGIEIERKNAGGTGSFMYHDQGAFNKHSSGSAECCTIGVASDLLQPGENLLAIQVHTYLTTDAIGNLISDGTIFIKTALCLSGGANLAPSSDPWLYQVGNFEPSGGLVDHSLFEPNTTTAEPNTWTLQGFNDSNWLSGPGGIGYSVDNINTDVKALVKYRALSVYMRQSFNADLATANSTQVLTFTVDYDDGYIAYLNGTEISRSSNMGSPGDFVSYCTPADGGHSTGTAVVIPLAAANSLLVEGENVLAIQVHNASISSTDLALIANLDIGSTPLVNYTNDWNYFIGTKEPSTPPESVTDEDDPSDFVDWIELENTDSFAISLNGWSLTDEQDTPDKWIFPDITLQPNERKVILCTGLDKTNAISTYLHTNFKLSAGGEYLALYSHGDILISEMAPFPKQDWRYTYGWDSPSMSYTYLKEATPGQTNSSDVFIALPTQPVASHESGLYDSTITVSLSAVAPAVDIYYTLDGSTPTPTLGTHYTSAISFSSAGVLRTVAITADGVVSDPVTYNYLVNIPDALKILPIICLTGDWDTSINKPHGITAIHSGTWSTAAQPVWSSNGPDCYNIPLTKGRPLERKIHMNVLYSDTISHTNYQANCGIRLAGSDHARPRFQGINMSDEWDEGPDKNKPQFNIFFRDIYGTKQFKNELFGDSDTSWKSLRIRSGKNDWSNPFTLDEVVRRLFEKMGQVVSKGTLSALYVNGIFRSYYNPVPRYDETFFQEAFNSSSDYDIINHGGVVEGDQISFDEMLYFAKNNDLSDPDKYREMERRLDIENFIDYLILNCYASNWDWPHNNWTASRERSALGRWRYHIWDAEVSFSASAKEINQFTGYLLKDPARALNDDDSEISILYQELHDSDIFRQHWYDRAWKHLAPNGALDSDSVCAINNELADDLDPIMQYVTGSSVDRTIVNDYATLRRTYFVRQMQAEDLWFNIDPPTFSLPSGTATNGTQIILSHSTSGGTIYYSLDGEDPRAAGGGISGEQYSVPISIDRSRHIKARVYKDGVWGALAEETYLTLNPKLLISEIMYNPADPPAESTYDNDDFEFIELYNSDSTTVTLSPVSIDNGIEFDFLGSEVTIINPNEYIVLVKNLEAFTTRYDTNNIIVAGTYTGKLSNGGETLQLMHDYYGILIKGSFSDEWYNHTDGDGYSLNLRNLSLPGLFEEKASWKPSSVYGGSPGQPDPDNIPEPNSIVINELLCHTDLSPVGDWVELYNTTDEPVDLIGWTLSDDPKDLAKYVIPESTIIPAYGYVLLNAKNHFDSSNARIPFAFSEHGDEAILTSPLDANGFLTGYRDEVDFDGAEREFTFGRHLLSDGEIDWTTLSSSTPGAQNAYPKVGPVIMYEIGYQPATNAVEFIQFYNITDVDLPLYEQDIPSNTWKVSGGIDFDFPTNVILLAYSSLILCAENPVIFRATYSIIEDVQIFGPFEGALDNQGDNIKLYRPGTTDELGTPRILIEKVKYNDKYPWPTITNGMNSTIQLIYNLGYGNEPTNWKLGSPNSAPKSSTQTDSDLDGLPDKWEAYYSLSTKQSGDELTDLDFDLTDNLSEYIAGTNPNDSNSVFLLKLTPKNGAAVISIDSIQTDSIRGYDGLQRSYSIEQSTTPNADNFTAIPNLSDIPATGKRISITNDLPTGSLFFRAKVYLTPNNE